MNIKTIRRTGALAFALAAFAGMFTQTAAASGSIRSITACDPETGPRMYGPSDLVRIGEMISFKVRLLNYNTNGAAATGPQGGRNNPWVLRRNPMYDATWATNNLPKMGLWISGHARYATLKSISLAGEGSQAGYYTDLVFEYKAQAGDMGLPVKFCNASGRDEILNSEDQTYLLENVGPATYWELVDATTGTRCEFTFGSELLSATDYSNPYEYRPPGWTPEWAINQGNEHRDYDLSKAQIYIQTIDFDESSSDIWRTIYENKTTTVEGKLPTLFIPGGAGDASTVYLWTEDSDVAYLENGVPYNALTPDKSAYKDYTVYTANIVNETNFTFKVKGARGATGRTTTIYLSTTPTNIYNSAGTRLINFVSRTIAVTNQANPVVSVELAPASITCDSAYGTSKALLTVTVDAFTNDITVALNPTLNGSPLGSGMLNISSSSDGALNAFSPTFTYPARSSMDDDPVTYTYHVFGLGFSTNDTYTSTSQQILFSPTITGDGGVFGAIDSFSLTVKESAPSFTISNVSDEGNLATAQVDFPLTISLSDSYANLHDTAVGYTVWWKPNSSAASWQLVKSGVKAVDGELDVSVKYTSGGDFTSMVRIYGPDGLRCDEDRSFKVTVAEAKRLSLSVDMDGDDEMPRTYYEGDPVRKVRVILHNWKNDTGAPLYAFLEPLDETASYISSEQFIVGHANCKGLKIEDGATNTVSQTKTFKTLDGDKTLSFRVVIATVENWSAVTVDNTVFTYDVEDIEVVNVLPKFEGVSMSGGTTLTVGDGSEKQNTDQGLLKTFTWMAYDVDADMATLKTRWTVYDPSGAQADQRMFTGDPAGQEYRYTFLQSTAGAQPYRITVEMQDKDMGSREWAKFEFKVEVGDAPKTVFQFPNGSDGLQERYVYTEDAVMNGLNDWFQVGLSTPAKDPLVIKVTRTPYGGTTGTFDMSGMDGSGAVYVTIPAGQTVGSVGQVSLAELDGTKSSSKSSGGYTIIAAVTNTNLNADGVPYNQVYAASSVRVLLSNIPPRVTVTPGMTGTNGYYEANVSANEILTIEWDVEDVDADMADNLTLKWSNLPSDATYVAGSATSPTGTIQFSFAGSGTHVVTLVVKDKDGDSSEQFTWKYTIESSKDVRVYPLGPFRSGQSDMSREYLSSFGLGKGRVYAEGTPTSIFGFRHSYSYTIDATEASLWAWGYRVGDVDDGHLDMFDLPIDPGGNNSTPGSMGPTTNYRYPDTVYDSFFYAWINNVPGEQGGATVGTTYPNPQIGTNGFANKEFQLPTETIGDEEHPSYQSLIIEAVFARELRPADNLGDINQDGIPDVYALRRWKGGRLYELVAGGGSEGDGGGIATPGADTVDVSAYNDDEDYLPASTTVGDTLIPNVIANWATTGERFTADNELRGFGLGLNYRADADGINPNVRGEWISIPELTAAEEKAYLRYYLPISGVTTDDPVVVAIAKIVATNDVAAVAQAKAACEAAGGDPSNEDEWMAYVTPSEEHLDRALSAYIESPAFKTAALEEFAKSSSSWTPENRTDPTVADTDGDGFPDGYEYYFWYMALVGDDNGKQLTGSRFNVNNVSQGIEITPAEIVAAFNPTVKSTVGITARDTDGDGLTDLEEFAIGTNPVHWDTDGDGMSDLYEVIWGLNPLKSGNEEDKNPDGDYMASWTSDETWAIITVQDKGVFAIDESKVILNGFIEGEKRGEGTLDTSAGDITIEAIPVFWYGADGSTPVPKDRMGPLTNLVTVVVTSNDTVAVVRGKALRLIHDQVYNSFGFDPRTGWFSNTRGYCGERWVPAVGGGTEVFSEGVSGRATNTVAFTSLDEYLLCKYRKETGLRGGDKLRDDLNDSYSSARKVAAKVLWTGCTAPNIPKDGISYGDLAETFGFNIYGADTDGDGVPDGWELYVYSNPNFGQDGSSHMDGDLLSLVEEFAGTDSCNAYESTPSVYQNHPGEKSGWYNKFFPTDPNDPDTDGDNVRDSDEGRTWRGRFYAGRKGGDAESILTTFTFIYGPNDGKPAGDDGSRCIRGGGLNPCTVDTDLDLLPDGWERQFAGVVFNAEGKPDGNSLSADIVKMFRFSDGLDSATGELLVTPTGFYITGGMDGTYGPKAGQPGDSDTAFSEKVESRDPSTGTRRDCDWDHDGLENFQEYLVQTLRHLRYDDSETPLMGAQLFYTSFGPNRLGFNKCIPFQAFDGTAFYETCRKAGFLATSAWKYRELGYFARPPHEWDRIALNTTGNANCSNYEDYEGTGYRILLPPHGLSYETTSDEEVRFDNVYYVSTDPRRWDSDDDGLDDYWELFHGLNPLLGKASEMSPANDVICSAYRESGGIGVPNAWINAWTGWPLLFVSQPEFDAMKYPWMIGTPECDADGDGIRNAEEGLFVNLTTPAPKHTDPTPLWMTDKTSPSCASFTAQYYRMDPYVDPMDTGIADIFHYPTWGWTSSDSNGASEGQVSNWMFSFEENEGYDTDSDRRPDKRESVKMVENASDPLNFADPDTRQALYLPGWHASGLTGEEIGSAVVSRGGSDSLQKQSGAYDLLRQFTVEAWVRPEKLGVEQVILERVSNYGISTLSNNMPVIRANFRLGVTADDMFYAEFEGNTADSGAARLIGTAATTNWTHIAFTFNGSTIAMYVDDGDVPVAKADGVSLIPANGIVIAKQEAGSGIPIQGRGYEVAPCAFIIGARAVAAEAIELSADTTWEAFDDYYTGWIDEVRVWDGARTGAEIAADFRRRYSFSDVKKLRQVVYQSWIHGATRNDAIGNVLPVELVQHYNFGTLAGAIDSGAVALEPLQFTEKVLDNVRVDGNDESALGAGGLNCGWWWELPVHSDVYCDFHTVPWVQNTCAHLPFMDGSVPDSMYWSENFGGLTPELNGYDFPNTANPYPFYNYLFDRAAHMKRLECFAEGANSPYTAFRELYAFQLRAGFIGTSDLVPLGGAFAKRTTEMWDGFAADAWTQTESDADSDGLPDWWEDFVAAGGNNGIKYAGEDGNPLAAEDIVWSAMVWRNGVRMTLAQAYQRDIADGMIHNWEDGSVVVDKAYAALVDANQNGIADWWERLYSIYGEDIAADHDNDQLSNFAEYLIGECFTRVNGVNRKDGYDMENDVFKTLDPTALRTYRNEGQLVPDYFRRVGSLYLGEMFTDHDFMEDWWERYINNASFASRYNYDPLKDFDDDGWSNFAECRHSLWKALTSSDMIDKWLDDGLAHVLCRPEPAVGLRVSYYGNRDVSGATLMVHVSPDSTMIGDAVFSVPASGTTSQKASTYIGQGRANTVMHGLMNPGSIVAGSSEGCKFYRVTLSSDVKYVWSYDWYRANAGTSISYGDAAIGSSRGMGTMEEYLAEYAKYPHIALLDTTLAWKLFATAAPAAPGSTIGQIIYVASSTTNGAAAATSGSIGTVNYRTGEFEIDTAKLAVADGTSSDLEVSVFKVDYSYRMGVEWPQTVYLSQPDSGYVHEGANVVSAFFDLDGNGVWTAGEPYGVAPAVDVGWWKTATEIELTDTNPSMARFDLSALYSNASSSQDSSSETNSSQAVSIPTDRSVNGSQYGNVVASNSISSAQVTSVMRLRVVRDAFNGTSGDGTDAAFREVVLDRTFNAKQRPVFTEADMVAAGLFDIDWETVFPAFKASSVGSSAKSALRSVTYRVFVGNGEILSPDQDTDILPVKFVNAFEALEFQSPTEPLAPSGIVRSGRPTFTWRHSNTIGKDYPMFNLRVYSADGSTLVYDSGVRKVPPRNAQGVYSWTAPLYVDMVTDQGQLFSNTNNYQWAVSMLDAKFPSFGPDEVRKTFRVECLGAGGMSDYGSLDVQVKYFGPATVSANVTDSHEKLIRVQAFDTPDFSGVPAGEVYVTDVSGIDSTTNLAVNARFVGLLPGTYYVRAFIDTNGDGIRQSWESWGYANYVNTDVEAAYNPRGLTIEADKATVPCAAIYIEDADTDDDGFPDVYEWEQSGDLDTISPASGDTFFTKVNPDLLDVLTAYTELNIAKSSSAAPILRMMSVATSSASGFNAMNALMSSSPTVENATDVAVVIESFSLDDGMTISIDPAVSVGTSGLFAVSATPVPFSLELQYKESLADAGWDSVASVPVLLTANEPVTLTGDDLAVLREKIAEIKSNGGSGFFKVVLTK